MLHALYTNCVQSLCHCFYAVKHCNWWFTKYFVKILLRRNIFCNSFFCVVFLLLNYVLRKIFCVCVKKTIVFYLLIKSNHEQYLVFPDRCANTCGMSCLLIPDSTHLLKALNHLSKHVFWLYMYICVFSGCNLPHTVH